VILSTYGNAQSFEWKWVVGASSNSISEGHAIAYSPDSAFVYVGGKVANNALTSLGPLSNILTSSSGVSGTEGYVVKYTNAGILVWGFLIESSGPNDVKITSISVNNLDEVIVGGTFEQTANFAGAAGVSTVNRTSLGNSDAFVAKYNSNGVCQWVVVGSSLGDDVVRDVKIIGSEVYASGGYGGSFSVTTGSGTSNLTLANSGGLDAFGLKVSSTGNLVWIVGAGSNQDDSYNSVSVFGGSAYFGGYYSGDSLGFQSTTVVSSSNSNPGFKEGVLAKYNATSGSFTTHALIAGPGDDEITDMTNDNSKIYYTGYFENATIFPGLSSVTEPHKEFFVARCASNFDTEWMNRATTSGVDTTTTSGVNVSKGNTLEIDSFQHLIVSGQYAGVTNFLGNSYTSNGGIDFLVSYIDPITGNNISTNSYGGSGTDIANAVSVKSNNEVYITGNYSNTVVFTPITKTATSNNNTFWGRYGCVAGSAVLSGNNTICAGDSTLLTFTATATSSAPYLYQYTDGTSIFSVGPVSVASHSISIFPSTTTTYQLLTFESFACSSAVSGAALVTVHPTVTNNDILNPNAICLSSGSVVLDGNLPTGGGGAYIYNWEFSQNGSPFLGLGPPVSTEDYSANATSTVTKYIRAVKTATCTNLVYSDTITVDASMSGNTITTLSQSICQGSSISILAGVPTNGGTYTYLWEKSPDNIVWSNADAVNNQQNYTPPILTSTTYFRRKASSGACGFSSSVSIKVTVDYPIGDNTINAINPTICNSTLPDSILGSTPTLGSGLGFAYLWQESTAAAPTWVNAVGANISKSYLPTLLSEPTYFRRRVVSGVCAVSFSNIDTIVVHTLVTNNTIVGDTTICYFTSPNAITGQPASNSYAISWEQNMDSTIGTGWIVIPGADTTSYNTGDLFDTTYFRRIIEGGYCPDSYSNIVTISVSQPIANNSISADADVCYGTDSLLLIGSTISGGVGNNTYSWEESTDNIAFNPIAINGNQSNYITGVMTIGTYFRRRVLNNACTSQDSVSNTIFKNVLENSFANIIASKDSLCSGDDITVDIALSGALPLTMYMTYGGTNYNVSGVSGTVFGYNFPPTSSNTLYLDSVLDNNGCIFNISDSITIRLITKPVTNIATNDVSLCDSNFTFSPLLSNGFAEFYSPTLGFLSTTFPLDYTTSTFGEHLFILKETNEICIDSDTVKIDFWRQIEEISAGEDQLVNDYYETYMDATDLIGTEQGVWDIIEGSANIGSQGDPKSLIYELKSGANDFLWTVSNGVCPQKSDAVRIFIQDFFIPSGFSPNGDGANDLFEIKGVAKFENIGLQVFNRWGNIVYESKNYQNDWDGTLGSGENLPDDTYFYILDMNPNEMHKGYLIIKR